MRVANDFMVHDMAGMRMNDWHNFASGLVDMDGRLRVMMLDVVDVMLGVMVVAVRIGVGVTAALFVALLALHTAAAAAVASALLALFALLVLLALLFTAMVSAVSALSFVVGPTFCFVVFLISSFVSVPGSLQLSDGFGVVVLLVRCGGVVTVVGVVAVVGVSSPFGLNFDSALSGGIKLNTESAASNSSCND